MSWINHHGGWKAKAFVLGAVLVFAGGLFFALPHLSKAGTAQAQDSGPYDYAYSSMGGTVPTSVWYLPLNDGNGSESFIVVLNPNVSAFEFDVDFMTASGPVAGPQDLSVAGGSRLTVLAESYTSGPASAKITATGSVVCDSMVFGNDRTWSYGSVGATESANSWYFADGCTAWGLETFVVIQNPNATTAETTTTLITPTGSSTSNHTVPANSCYVLDTSTVVPDSEISIKVEADEPVVCERTMYGNSRSWAHATVGSTNPATTWYFAEGNESSSCDTWLIVQNPGVAEVTAHLSFMNEAGAVTSADFAVTANSRITIDPGMHATGRFSTKVVATGAVICERVMYASDFAWGHCSMGVYFAMNSWYFADGYTGYPYETYVLIQNPNTSAVNVTLTFMQPTGSTYSNIVIPAQSRYTVNVNQAAPNAYVSTKVVANLVVVCERSMYHQAPKPSISTISPASNVINSLVTISGDDFGATRGTSKVRFGDVVATYYESWSDTQIVCKVPAGTSGALTVTVTTPAGESNAYPFKVLPRLVKLVPKYGTQGATITLQGSGFGATRGTSYVKFGTVKVTNYISWTPNEIQVKVPAGAAGLLNVSVTTTGGTSNLLPFKVTPRITKISPASGPVGTTVTVTGAGFGATRGTSTVKFGITAVTSYVSWSNTQIVVKVPQTGVGTKDIVVTTSGGKSNGFPFTVL
ncbi:MAG: IPT/TIG domain-containing protein [Actinomycetota bacterium]